MRDRNRVEPTQSLNLEASRIVDETLVKSAEPLSSESLQQAEHNLPRQFGRYLIQNVLGRGAMGSVYLAEDTVLHRQCALKMPHFDKKRDREMLDRFYREAQAAARVKHANICDIYDIGEIDGVHFISMEYVAGRPLTHYISPSKPGRQRATVQLILKLSTALEQAHKQQIVHRDLKPANIMIKENKQPVVMDFGLACSLETSDKSRVTTEGTILGSPAYMSPEQVLGRINEVGPTSDVYSLGVILFEMLTGRLPFQGSVNAILGQIIGQEPPRPRELRPDLDAELEATCLKMMSKGPRDRYQTMGEVSAALTDWLRRVDAGEDGAETLVGASPPTNLADVVPRETRPPEMSQQPVVKRPDPVSDEVVDPRAATIVTTPKPVVKVRRREGQRWLVILTGIVGLLAAILLVATRYFEIQKAWAEAEVAENARSTNPPPNASPSTPVGGAVPSDTLSANESKLQGRWKMTSMTVDPRTFPGPTPTDETWTFRGRDLSLERKHMGVLSTISGSYSLGQTGEPRHFDYDGSGWSNAQVQFRGIYTLEGDLLTVCFVPQPATTTSIIRADTFTAPPGSGRVVVRLRRE